MSLGNSTDGPSGPNEGGGDSALRATYAGAKRRIAALESQVKSLEEEGGVKKKSDIISNISVGRCIGRLVSMFELLEDLVDEKDRRRALELQLEEDEGEGTEDLANHSLVQDRTYRGYELLVQNITSMEQKLLDLDTPELGGYFRDLRKGSGCARGDDAANLKPAIASWVGTLYDPDHAHPPLSPTNKSERGFEHYVTGKLICPIDYTWEDPSIRQRIHDGHEDFIVTADSWPAFLFPRAKANPEDIERGLFRSAMLLKAYKFIFISPTSAEDIENEKDVEEPPQRPHRCKRQQRAPTRGHVASIIGMKSVTPRSIAYTAVQLRFSLSNASAWHENEGCFSYVQFYNNIIDFFETTPGPAAQKQARELLSWWSRQVVSPTSQRANIDAFQQSIWQTYRVRYGIIKA